MARVRAAAAPHPNPLPASGERERALTPRPVYGEREGPSAKRWEGEGQIRFALACGLTCFLLTACNSVSLPGWPKPPPAPGASAGAWARPGADAATIESAYDDCLNVANSATQKDFDIDQ